MRKPWPIIGLLHVYCTSSRSRLISGIIPKGKAEKRIVAVVLRSGPMHNEFLKRVVGKNCRQYSIYWKKAVFSGIGKPHKSFDSELKLEKFVSSTPGAIGYIDSAAPHPGCLVISLK